MLKNNKYTYDIKKTYVSFKWNNINIDNIIRSGGFNGVTDADVYEILVFITGKTIFDDRYYPPKNKIQPVFLYCC